MVLYRVWRKKCPPILGFSDFIYSMIASVTSGNIYSLKKEIKNNREILENCKTKNCEICKKKTKTGTMKNIWIHNGKRNEYFSKDTKVTIVPAPVIGKASIWN